MRNMGGNQNIFLVGLMGAGKTTIGRLLARRLKREFVDSDHEIEGRCGVRVSVIFDIEGEAGFRAREVVVIDEVTARNGIVLATGGGAVLDAASRGHLASRGTVIYLHSAPAHLWERTRHDKSRPLLANADPKRRLEELYRQRDPLYREVADLVVDTGRQSASTLVRRLLAQLSDSCKVCA
jgi:shikimate kinase